MASSDQSSPSPPVFLLGLLLIAHGVRKQALPHLSRVSSYVCTYSRLSMIKRPQTRRFTPRQNAALKSSAAGNGFEALVRACPSLHVPRTQETKGGVRQYTCVANDDEKVKLLESRRKQVGANWQRAVGGEIFAIPVISKLVRVRSRYFVFRLLFVFFCL